MATEQAIAAPSGSVTVDPYRDERDEWDGFVRRSSGATPFHLIAWKRVLERTFSYRSFYLVARRGGEIAGVLPLFELSAPFMERRLLSLPFAVEAGVCASDEEARRALDDGALALARERGARSIELRDGLDVAGFQTREGLYYRFRSHLHGDDAEALAAVPAKRRNRVRFAARRGLTARTGAGDVAVFHDLYAHTARHYGTPLFPLRFFRHLLEELAGDCAVLTVWLGEAALGGAVILFFGDTAHPYYVGARRDSFRYATSEFLYWEAMRYAWRRGARVFDFGRSKRGTGAYDFKRWWGITPEPMRYRVLVCHGRGVLSRSTEQGGVRLLQSAWRHLPLPMTKILGPPVVARWGAYFT